MSIPPWFPSDATYYTIGDRTQDGIYEISGRRNAVFEFMVPVGGYNQIVMVISDRSSQDLSIRAWFSEKPYGDMLFNDVDVSVSPYALPKAYMYDNIYMPVPSQGITIFDKNDGNYSNMTLKLLPGKYYLNLQNRQGRNNQYRLTFSSDNEYQEWNAPTMPLSPNEESGPVGIPSEANPGYVIEAISPETPSLPEQCGTCGYGKDGSRWKSRIKPCKKCGREGGRMILR